MPPSLEPSRSSSVEAVHTTTEIFPDRLGAFSSAESFPEAGVKRSDNRSAGHLDDRASLRLRLSPEPPSYPRPSSHATLKTSDKHSELGPQEHTTHRTWKPIFFPVPNRLAPPIRGHRRPSVALRQSLKPTDPSSSRDFQVTVKNRCSHWTPSISLAAALSPN
jgi:hypothetical protein